MSNIEHEIMAFATTVRHLLLKYEKMKEELCDIKSRLADEERQVRKWNWLSWNLITSRKQVSHYIIEIEMKQS